MTAPDHAGRTNPLVQVVKIATAIEGAVDTQKLMWAGINLWPVMRRILHFTRLDKDPKQPAKLADIERDQRFDVELTLPRSPAERDEIADTQKAMLEGERAVDFLFISRLLDHSDTVNGQAYNRLIDPYLWHLRDRYSCLKLEFAESLLDTSDRFEPTEVWTLPDWRQDRALLALPSEVEGLEPIKAALGQIYGAPFPEDALTGYLPALWVRRAQFEELLKRLAPKAVFVICYYSPDMLALTWACRELGIPVIDIQHGQQGPYQLMYNHWTAAPPEGYALLPDHFFCWGDPTRQAQIKHLSEDRMRPLSHIAGHPWVGLWRQDGPLQVEGALNEALKPLRRDRVILCALQPTAEYVVPPLLLEAIQQRADWVFLVRLHPHQHHKRQDVEADLIALGTSNWVVDVATQAPLYPLIQFSDHVVTLFSSVAWEASAFGKPVTIIDPRGFDVYAEAIESGLMRPAQTADDLITSVEENWQPARSEAAFIESDPALIEEAIQAVMAG